MRRILVMTLACMGLHAVSCEVQQIADPALELIASAQRTDAAASVAVRSDVDPLALSEDAGAAREAVPTLQEHILAELERRHTGLSEGERLQLAGVIISEAEKYDLDPLLVLAVIMVESSGYHRAVSSVGALGLMQLLPATAEELAGKLGLEWRGRQTLFDPFVNVQLGTAYLRQLSDRYDHMPTALAAYNWGPGHIDRRLRNGTALPTLYPGKVMKAYEAKYVEASSRS